MKMRKIWKLTHNKFGDEFYMSDAELKFVKSSSLNTLRNYSIQRVFILS